MSTATEFETWWNGKYLYNYDSRYQSLYKALKKLYDRGAPIHCIHELDILGCCLILGDTWTTGIDNSWPRRKRNHRSTSSPAPLHLNDSLNLQTKVEGALNGLRDAVDDIETMARRFQRSPLLAALLEFHVPQLVQHGLPRKGDKLDSWGSFFLLAVTEYMKQEFGQRKPHYRLADELLRAYRTIVPYRLKRRERERTGGKARAIDRIKKLKQSHPLWCDALTPLLLQLQLNRNGVKNMRASTRNFLERWESTKPLTRLVGHHLGTLGLTAPNIALLEKHLSKR
jgi:hypothetical protein